MTATHKFTTRAAFAVVVANMIGTGVFTSLGFQLLDIQSPFVILLLWVAGGVLALCGALTYAELGAAMPRSGGEYQFLRELYHPAAGFVSGWISATIGFAAPTALAAVTFATYVIGALQQLPAVQSAAGAVLQMHYLPTALASILVLLVAMVHGSSHRVSGGFQSIFTIAKLLLIGFFCLFAVVMARAPQAVSFWPQSGDLATLGTGAFAVALIYVNYAYTGWNAATYLSSELAEPERRLPVILGLGTASVMIVYVALNAVFLYLAPIDAMAGEIEVGLIAASYLFGPTGTAVMGLLLGLLLISTVSAMVLAGPRVLQVIGEDTQSLQVLARANRNGVPVRAIAVQTALTLLFLWSASFETILVFTGFTLGLNTVFTVAGVFILRSRDKLDTGAKTSLYKVPLYPLPPLIYLAIMIWTLTYLLMERPAEAGTALLLISAGLIFYWLTHRRPADPVAHDSEPRGPDQRSSRIS